MASVLLNSPKSYPLDWTDFSGSTSALLRGLVGGEVSEYTKLMTESREQALDRMAEEARDLGATAIVGVRFQTSMVMAGAVDLLAFGTAVVLTDQ